MERANNIGILSCDAYATAADFEQIFTDEMSALYLLSFLLTGDREKAEDCFVTGIGECAQGNRVFKEWARSWARRTIIRSAIRLVAPLQHPEEPMRDPDTVTMDKLPLVSQEEVSAILELKPVERFVFVMSALEHYSDHDCSVLLGCTRRNVIEARSRALQRLGMLMKSQPNSGFEELASRENVTPIIRLTIARHFPVPPWSRTNGWSAPASAEPYTC